MAENPSTTECPRITPLAPEEFTAEQQALVGDWSVLTFSRVMARHPDLYRVFVPFIEKVIRRTALPPRDRQVLVLRTLARCGDTYESAHHVDISHKIGMTDQQIAAIQQGDAGLPPFDRLLIKAADELVVSHCLSDETWRALAERYSSVELMEVVGLVGCYTTMAMITRSFDIPLESANESASQLKQLRTYN